MHDLESCDIVLSLCEQVFVAQKKGCSDDFAAKRITLKDSDLFDKQAEVATV